MVPVFVIIFALLSYKYFVKFVIFLNMLSIQAIIRINIIDNEVHEKYSVMKTVL
jgi:hypothetical protein